MNPWVIIGVGVALLAAAYSGYRYGDNHRAAIDTAAIEHQKAEASSKLAVETNKVLVLERTNTDLNTQLEKKAADDAVKNANAGHDLDAAVRDWVRRHPPGCRSSGSAAGSAPSSSGNTQDAAASSDATEILPVGSTRFIQQVSSAADALASYARECHAFVTHLTCATSP